MKQENGIKILLVDDDVDFSKATSKILTDRGYNVVTASDGKEARAMLKKEKPDLIILDIMLPGQDGFSLCREFKDNTQFFEIPILILTSMNDDEAREKYSELIALYHNADAYAEKPVKPKELLAKVYELVTWRKYAVTETRDRKKILIIDDDHDFTRSVRSILEENDYEVQVADTAKGGLHVIKTMHPDVILTEAILPDKDGFSLTRELKTDTQTYNIPILMVTRINEQFSKPDFAQTLASNHKADELIYKPVDPESLMDRIAGYV